MELLRLTLPLHITRPITKPMEELGKSRKPDRIVRLLPTLPPNSSTAIQFTNHHHNSGASYASAGNTTSILHPTTPWQTSCNGPNYISHLVTSYNKSVITPKSYAIPGSPVSWYVLNGDKTPDPKTQGNSFVFQVETYVDDIKKGDVLPSDMSGANTLFHMEFGINDINQAGSNYSRFEGEIFEEYRKNIETVPSLPLTKSTFKLINPALQRQRPKLPSPFRPTPTILSGLHTNPLPPLDLLSLLIQHAPNHAAQHPLPNIPRGNILSSPNR